MPDRTAELIQPYLNPGEQLIWTGRPRTGIMLRRGDSYMIPLSLLWGGFAFLTEYLLFTSGGNPWVYMPFVLIGIYIIIGRFFIDAARRSKLHYALTNQRALVLSEYFGGRIKSFNLRSLTGPMLEEKSDWSGTISFGPMPYPSPQGMAGMQPRGVARIYPPPLMFEELPAARTVYEMIQDIQEQAQRVESGW